MTFDDILTELTSFDGVLLTNNNKYEILGKVKCCLDLLILVGEIDKTKLQNSVIKERQKLVDKYGFPVYNVALPNHETPVSHWAQ